MKNFKFTLTEIEIIKTAILLYQSKTKNQADDLMELINNSVVIEHGIDTVDIKISLAKLIETDNALYNIWKSINRQIVTSSK